MQGLGGGLVDNVLGQFICGGSVRVSGVIVARFRRRIGLYNIDAYFVVPYIMEGTFASWCDCCCDLFAWFKRLAIC